LGRKKRKKERERKRTDVNERKQEEKEGGGALSRACSSTTGSISRWISLDTSLHMFVSGSK
jgi:hypothetical protein